MLTIYNHALYKIEDIDTTKTVSSKFMKDDNTEISFKDYYKKRYGCTIKDEK